jgi:hypothetical protein
MAKARSPNYPNYDLKDALVLVDKVYKNDGRNKVSRSVLAEHLGHESLSGPALGKIGALRAYGLVEGGGEELYVSEDAIAALKAPAGSQAHTDAIRRLAFKPAVFQAIKKQFPAIPSKANLVYSLIQEGFSDIAAGIAADSYLKTMALVESLNGSYNAENQGGNGESRDLPTDSWSHVGKHKAQQVKIMEGERELTTGLLSKDASFRLIVSGQIGVKEIDRLIQKLTLDKEILAETDAVSAEAFAQGGGVGKLGT